MRKGSESMHRHTAVVVGVSGGHRSQRKSSPWPKLDSLSHKIDDVVLGYNPKYKIHAHESILRT